MSLNCCRKVIKIICKIQKNLVLICVVKYWITMCYKKDKSSFCKLLLINLLYKIGGGINFVLYCVSAVYMVLCVKNV